MAPPSERSSDASRLLAFVSDSWKSQAVHVAARSPGLREFLP